MNLENYYGKIAKDLKDLGIEKSARPSISCDEIISISELNLNTMPLEELEDLMIKFSSYNAYLKSQKGSIEAQLRIINAEFERKLAYATQTVGDKYTSKEEKKAMALAKNGDLDKTWREILVKQAEVDKIKELPFALDKVIDLLKIKHRRRMADEQKMET